MLRRACPPYRRACRRCRKSLLSPLVNRYLSEIFLCQLAEMVAHRRQCHRLGEALAVIGINAANVAPEFCPLAVDDAEPRYKPEERRDPTPQEERLFGRRLRLRDAGEAFEGPAVIF